MHCTTQQKKEGVNFLVCELYHNKAGVCVCVCVCVCVRKKEEETQTQTQTEERLSEDKEDGHAEAKDRGLEKILPSQLSEGNLSICNSDFQPLEL